jgi:hypothetical protein
MFLNLVDVENAQWVVVVVMILLLSFFSFTIDQLIAKNIFLLSHSIYQVIPV